MPWDGGAIDGACRATRFPCKRGPGKQIEGHDSGIATRREFGYKSILQEVHLGLDLVQ